MKTILEVTGRMDRGGAETMLVDIIKQTYKSFNYVFLINVKDEKECEGQYDSILKSLGCKFYYIGTIWSMGISEYTKRFGEICSEICNEVAPIDVVHCHMNSKCGTVLRAAERAGIKKRIAHSHAEIRFNGSILSVIINYAELYFQKILINKYATDFWGCSEKALLSLYSTKHLRSDKCKIIKNAIDVNRFVSTREEDIEKHRLELRIPRDKKIIGTVGRIARVKNTKFLVEVFNELHKKTPDTCLVVVGGIQDETYGEEILQIVKSYGLEDSVIFTGVQSKLELVYPLFDVFVGASLREGLGLVSVEAQACGIECILSDGFPQEADIGLGLVKFIKGFEIKLWNEHIEKVLCSTKKSSVDKSLITAQLALCGYDAVEEARKVQTQYENSEH